MATVAQTRANRLNAQKSTGPRTPEGKAVVSQNAVKHGLLARAAVLQGEDWEEFTEFRENLIEELCPEGTLEVLLAERIVSLSWRLQRAARLQNEAYEALYLKEATSAYGKMMRAEMARGCPAGAEAGADDLVGGRLLVEDFGGCKILDRMLLYERRIEHSLYRTMGELKKLRLIRKAGKVSSLKREVSREQGRAPALLVLPLRTSHLKPPPKRLTASLQTRLALRRKHRWTLRSEAESPLVKSRWPAAPLSRPSGGSRRANLPNKANSEWTGARLTCACAEVYA